MTGRPPHQSWTDDQIRIDRQWTLFGEKYPDFCVPGFQKFRSEGLFVAAASETADTERQAAARTYHDAIIALDEAELNSRWIQLQRAEAAQREAKHPLNAALATGVVYDFYSKASYWTLDEGVALLLERDPKRLNSDWVQKFKPPPLIGQEFIKLQDLARRAARMQQLAHQNLPGFFLSWAKRNRLPVPEALEQAVIDHGHQVGDWKTLYDQQREVIAELQARISQLETAPATTKVDPSTKPFDPRERASLLKMVLGMAIAIYGHDPRQTRITTVSEIKSELDRVGISLSDDTIRRYIREANEYAPD